MKQEKQELLKWIDENKIGRPSVFGLGTVETVYKDDLIEKINQFDEPQKAKVPLNVGNWIEYSKDEGWNFLRSTQEMTGPMGDGLVARWFKRNSDKYAEAWSNDFEVEEEPKWIVRVGEKLIFKEFDENEFPVFVIDDKPGSIQLAENFDLEKKAHNVQKEVGGTVEKV